MANNSVKSWRDEVSATLGRLDERTQQMTKKLDTLCKTQTQHDERIDALEIAESNRQAVSKKVYVIIGLIVSVITTLANIAWKIFK